VEKTPNQLLHYFFTFEYIIASRDRGIWIAIWSPSNSTLNPTQTNGWRWITHPPIKMGWNACMPNLCRMGISCNEVMIIECIQNKYQYYQNDVLKWNKKE